MKDRIIRYLDDFSNGESQDLAIEILADFSSEGRKITADQLRDKSAEVLSLILHQYSQFSVSTIDAFFQRVIRSFTRETNLLGNFRLEVDNDLVLEEVIDLLMDDLTKNEELCEWVMQFSIEQMIEGKDWDIRKSLLAFAHLIFAEEFKTIEEEVQQITDRPGFFKAFKQKLTTQVSNIESKIIDEAQDLLTAFRQQGLAVSDFKHGGSGSVYSYLEKLVRGSKDLPGVRVQNALNDSRDWPSPKTLKASLIISMASQHWLPRLKSLVEFLETNRVAFFSAEQALENLYSFGLLSDISRTLKKYLADKNLMLLSDAPKFLSKLMNDQDASFIYEKVGSFYRHYLVDEFQDTSMLQWKNVLPLIRNGIAQNYKSLIVGDIKQSIYRWRGGDLNILQNQVSSDVGTEQVNTFSLATNYRSAGNIVSFNNALFGSASAIISKETGTDFSQRAYNDAHQHNFKWNGQGYVSIQFLDAEETEEGLVKFEQRSLELLPRVLEQLQDSGISIRDVAFLVRDNKDGQKIAKRFMEYRSSEEASEKYQYDVVSNESLRLDQASSVLVLINAMRFIDNPTNEISAAHLAYENSKLWSLAFPDDHKTFSKSQNRDFAELMPLAFTTQHQVLSALPLQELVENLILIFNLGTVHTEIAYLQAFQDIVQEFLASEKSDLTSFLQWWEDNKEKKSIQVAAGVKAARIITIHKSKGLQFKYVIIPFLDWDLNHQGLKAPILWCKSDEGIFKDAGYLPLKYKAELKNTYFESYYTEERNRIFLDNLNLLYVAFTRAEEGLIAYAPWARKEVRNTHVGNLVRNAIQASDELKSNWSEEWFEFLSGKIEVLEKESEEVSDSFSLRSYPVVPWRERLKVRTSGKDFFTPSEKREKINHGIFLHTLMSRIKVKNDMQAVIEQAVLEGVIRADEKEGIAETVQWIVTQPELQAAFDGSAKIKNEVSLLIPGGERRIDRIAIHDNRAIVVDYKTGTPTTHDEQQVTEYKQYLLAMGLEKVNAFLVYVNTRKCVEV